MTAERIYESVQIGCQGWNYDDWITPAAAGGSIFYPRGTRAPEMLEVYARAFQTVEVDSTFYAVPAAAMLDQWAARTPRDFTFALKLPQIITHQLALRGESEATLKEFCTRARRLKEKLAAVLIQLPPQFVASPQNWRALREFLPLLPRDINFHLEFRDPAWFDETVLELLTRQRGVNLALVESQWVACERIWQLAEKMEAGAVYARWMGARDLARFDRLERPQDSNLRAWSEVIKKLAGRGSQVCAYFSNFYEGHAPASASRLKRLLGQTTLDPQTLESQPSLF